jgi:hypothetical protein
VNAAFCGGAFAGDHAIAHNRQCMRGGIAAGNLRWFERADRFGWLSDRGRHWYFSFLIFLFWVRMSMRA